MVATRLPDVLVRIAAAGLVMVFARLALTLFLVVAARLGPARVRRRTARLALKLGPGALRPLLVLALGTSVGLATAGSASAAAPPTSVTAPATSTTTSTATKPTGPLPDVGWDSAPPAAAPTPQPHADLPAVGWVASAPAPAPVPPHLVSATGRRDHEPERDQVIVRRGDTLWSLAARQLGPAASDAEIADQWPHWWAANRDRVGPDPDLLVPGTVLVAPAGGVR